MQQGYWNAPIVIAALAYETAILRSLNAQEIEIEKRTERYHKYFREAISGTKQGSLLSQYLALDRAYALEFNSFESGFSELKRRFDTASQRSTCTVEGQVFDSGEEGTDCRVGIWTWRDVCTRVVWDDIMEELNTLLNSLRRNIRANKHRDELHDAMIPIIRGILDMLGQKPHSFGVIDGFGLWGHPNAGSSIPKWADGDWTGEDGTEPETFDLSNNSGPTSNSDGPIDPSKKVLEDKIMAYTRRSPPSYLDIRTRSNHYCCPPCL